MYDEFDLYSRPYDLGEEEEELKRRRLLVAEPLHPSPPPSPPPEEEPPAPPGFVDIAEEEPPAPPGFIDIKESEEPPVQPSPVGTIGPHRPPEGGRPEEIAYRVKRGARLGTEDAKAAANQMASNFLSAEQNLYVGRSVVEAKADITKLEEQIAATEKELSAAGGRPDLAGTEWYYEVAPEQREQSQKLSGLRNQLGQAKQAATGGPVTESFAGSLSRAAAEEAEAVRDRKKEIKAEYGDLIKESRNGEYWMQVADSAGQSLPSMGASMLNPAFGLAFMYAQTFETSRAEFLEKGGDPAKADEVGHMQAALQVPWEIFGDLAVANLAKATIKRLVDIGAGADPKDWAKWIGERATDLTKVAVGEAGVTTPAQTIIEQEVGEVYGYKPHRTPWELAGDVAKASGVALGQVGVSAGGPVMVEAAVRAATPQLGAPVVAIPPAGAVVPPAVPSAGAVPPTETAAPGAVSPGAPLVVPPVVPGVTPPGASGVVGVPPGVPPVQGAPGVPSPIPGGSIFSTDPEARTDIAEFLTDKMDRGLSLASNVQPDGSVKVSYGLEGAKNELTVDLTPEERKGLKLASNDLELAVKTGAPAEEVAAARKAQQDILQPATRRRLAEDAAPLPAAAPPVVPMPGPFTSAGQVVSQYVGQQNLAVKQVADKQAQNLQVANAPKTARAIQQVAGESNQEASVTAAQYLEQAQRQAAEAAAAGVSPAEAAPGATAAVRPPPLAPAAPSPIPGAVPVVAPAPPAAPAPAAPTEQAHAVVVGGQVFTGDTATNAALAAQDAVGPDAMRSAQTGWVDPETGRFVSHEIYDAYAVFNAAVDAAGGNETAPAVQQAGAQLAEAQARYDEISGQIVSPGGEQVVQTGIKQQEALVSVRPSQELVVPLAGVNVAIEGVSPGGEKVVARHSAAQALNDARNDKTACQILLNCLT